MATGPLAPSLLHQLLSVIERDPGVEAGKDDDEHPDTGERFKLRDYMVRWDDDDTHSLFVAGELPGDIRKAYDNGRGVRVVSGRR